MGCAYVIPSGNKVKKITLYTHQGWDMSNEYVMDDIMSIEGAEKHKLTILSPVQLEKVGDVADRIICKDGDWGVEKNINEIVLNGSENWHHVTQTSNESTMLFQLVISDCKADDTSSVVRVLSDKFVGRYRYNVFDINNVIEGISEAYLSISDASQNGIFVRILKSKLSTQDVSGFKQWLRDNPTLVKYQLVNPTFIPLPYSQQVKLRTFANKTNISFLTEIEGTIKAQVPKSLGATVNTHTEQINNLNKELDRVKKLEESTVSTVTTESDFTTVEATSNGYFEDVKLEGKTILLLLKQRVMGILKM